MLQTFSLKRSSQINKLTLVFNVCPVNDQEFFHNIVKVAVDPRGDIGVDPQNTTKFIVTDALKTDINLFFTITTELSNCPFSLVDVLHKL